MPIDYSTLADDDLAELDTLLLPPEHARWQHFYADRARPCPFFGLAPDENLSEWVADGRLAPGSTLDIGCGNGRNAIFLAREGFEVTGVDGSASAFAWASDEVAKADARVSLHCCSIFDLPLAAGSHDIVYDSGCFHHMPPHRRHQYVRLVADALRPAGALGLVCFAPEGGSGYSDEEVYERGSLGGGLGYDEAALREIWSGRFRIDTVRRMRERDADSDTFGKRYLWALLAHKR